MKMLRCKADAEDVVQETFAKWLTMEHGKIKNTKAYLIRAVTNNCLKHLDSLKRKKNEYLQLFHWPEFLGRFRETDFSGIDVESLVMKVFHVVQHRLEPLERAVYLLKEVFGFDYKALHELLNKKQEHCRQLLCRAKKKLSREIPSLPRSVPALKTSLWESFRKACDLGNADEFVLALQRDIEGTPQI